MMSIEPGVGTEGARRGAGRGDDSRNLARLLEVTKAICRILDLDELLEVVLDKVLEVTGAQRGLLLLYGDAGDLTIRAARNFQALDGDRISRSITEQVAATGVPVCATDVQRDDDVRCRKSVLELGLLSIMCVPLTIKSRTLGVLYVDSRRVSDLFTPGTLSVFGALADHAAVAIENARLYEMAITDQKTGLFNHSHFLRRLEEALDRHERYGRPFGLLMIDIDHFKSVNDRHGHRAGDRVLAEIAAVLRRSIRASDLAARYGGEEFAVLLSEIGPEGESPLATAERLRLAVAEHGIAVDGATLAVTVSAGAASVASLAGPTAQGLIELADRLLYRAKREGRNRVCAPEGER